MISKKWTKIREHVLSDGWREWNKPLPCELCQIYSDVNYFCYGCPLYNMGEYCNKGDSTYQAWSSLTLLQPCDECEELGDLDPCSGLCAYKYQTHVTHEQALAAVMQMIKLLEGIQCKAIDR